MKFKPGHIMLLLATMAMLAACGGRSSKRVMPSLSETYSKKDSKPFGAEIAYRQVAAMYPGNIIRDRKQSFKQTWQNISDTGALYICMAPRLFVTEEDAEAMLEFVDAGNSLFISASYIDETLLKLIGCNSVYTNPAIEKMVDRMKKTGVNNIVQPGFDFTYYYHPFQNYFTEIDSSDTRILGYNDNKRPNFIVYFYGRGRLFLQCEPRAFSNYFLLKDNNYNYLKTSLAYTRSVPEHVYWDDYYHKLRYRKEKGFSSLGEIMKHPPLQFAFWLALALLLLYILFGGKRVQRIIPQLKANDNTTVTFTETIGRLYLQKKDNKNIAEKMITYFNEYIRNTYFLNTNHINDDFIAVLSRKSGVEKDKVDTLFRAVRDTQQSAAVTDYQLLSLHEQIQRFYKKQNS